MPQIWLDSDRQEDMSGETWTDGHVKSRLAQEMQPAEEAGGIRGERQAWQPGSFSSHLLPEGKPALASLGGRNAKLVLLLDYAVLAKRNKRHGVTPSPRGAARNNTNLTSHTSWRRGLIWLQELLEKEPNLPSSSHGSLHLPPDPVPFLARWYPQCSADSKLLLANRSADTPCSSMLAWDSSVLLPSHTMARRAMTGPSSAVAGPEGDGAADTSGSSTPSSLHPGPWHCSSTSSLELGTSRASPACEPAFLSLLPTACASFEPPAPRPALLCRRGAWSYFCFPLIKHLR